MFLNRLLVPLLTAISALSACDWGHSTMFRINSADGVRVSTVMEQVAQDAGMSRGHQEFSEHYPLGAFVDPRSEGRATRIWLGGRRDGESTVVDLRSFNEGSPWKPGPRFQQIEQLLEAALWDEFAPNVAVRRGRDKLDGSGGQ